MASNLDTTLDTVMKNIYTSCDPDNSNLVPVSKIIEFITPYMLEDFSALESLRTALDPQNDNVCINSEQFFELMNEWTKKIANSSSEESSDFNRTPSKLDVVDDKQLPYTHSTPRASFGQKLLSCEGLLNLSNVSSYSLSTSMQAKDSNTVAAEKTILEEEIKRLEHHLSKVTNEMVMVKLQLTAAEEQNEILQTDLDRCKTRLHSEQQIIEHLQNDKRYNDELREELNSSKKQIEELTRKLLLYEKDNHHLYGLIEQTEKENTNLENRCEELSRREQDAKKEIIDFKTELDLKEQEIATILKINEELKMKVNEQRDLIDQLSNENELLNHKKDTLEKALRENMSARRDSLVSQYKTCLADLNSFPNLDESNEEECINIQPAENQNFPCESLQAEICKVSSEKGKSSYSNAILAHENNENQRDFENIDLNYNSSTSEYQIQITQLKIKNDNIQMVLNRVNKENEQLSLEITEMKNNIISLEQEVSNLLAEKIQKEENLIKIQKEKKEVENEIRELKFQNSALKDENNNLIENNKSVKTTLEAKHRMLIELDEKLLELKRECTNLQIENITKEKELCEVRNKFDFETPFKKLQIDLNQKNQEISVMKRSNEELKDLLSKITNENQELQKSLKQTNLDLKEYQEKSKQTLMLNENIEYTASQVQLYIDRKNSMITELVELNKKFEHSINKLQKELQMKIKEVTDLRDCLKSDTEIKNIMWRDNKELKLKLDAENKRSKELLNELKTIKEKDEEKEFNILLSRYNQEVDNNSELCDQILMQKEELSSALTKYNEEVEQNYKLKELVSTLKHEIDYVKVNQDEYKENINKKLGNYEELIKSLEGKLHEQILQNDNLKVELESEKKKPKKERFFDVDIIPSDSSKNRSFEKQKLCINRLKEKLEETEVQLQTEKMKGEKLGKVIKERDELEEKFTKIQFEFEQAEIKNLLEKQSLETKIIDLSGKIKTQEENYLKLEKLKNENEKVLSLKLSQVEQQYQHLFVELSNKDFIINNSFVEIEAYKNLIANADRKSQELSAKISAYKSQINDKEKKIQLLQAEVTEKSNKTSLLSSKITHLEMQLTKVLEELSEKTEVNLNLENQNKSLQEMLSKSDDHKEKELMDTEQKLKSTCRLLQCSEMELNLIQIKVSESKQEFDVISREISEHKNIISSSRNELSRASTLALKKWENDLEAEGTYEQLLIMKECESSEEEDELVDLNNKVKFVVFLLEVLANKAPKSMEESEFRTLNTEDNSSLDGTTVKKFSLRPSKLNISLPASPDSPSVDIDKINNYNVQEVDASRNSVNQDPDNHNCQDLSYNTEDSFKTACEEVSYNQIFDLTTEDAFPNVSDAFLEKLGLHGTSPKKSVSKEETERLFTTFAIQIALESKDIKERLQNRKDVCIKQYENFLSVITGISHQLRDHKCKGAANSINTAFVLLEELKFLLKDIAQSIGYFGMLSCENRMMRCWNLVTNYMAFLKQDVVKLENHQNTRNQNENVAVKNSSVDDIKGSENVNSKEEENCENSTALKDNVNEHLCRYRCSFSVRSTITLVLSLIFFVLIIFIFAHWQCRMTVPESQMCVLDDFIKKIQVGNPPY